MNNETFLTFAYGSNMCSRRLQQRVPSAVVMGIGQLTGYLLRWHKRSSDGSGKCDAEFTGSSSDSIRGVLFKINRAEKTHLDEAEGLHNGYSEKEVEVTTVSGTVRALIYYATAIDPSLRPYNWYKAFVVCGAREHGLPEDYIRDLETVPATEDPDSERAARNSRLLSAGF